MRGMRIFGVMLAMSLLACATAIDRDRANARSRELAADQFSFEFACAKENIETKVLESGVGASGCGQRKVYNVACPAYGSPSQCFIVR